MTEPVPEPEPDGSLRHVAVRPTVFRPGLFTAFAHVGVIWTAPLAGSLRRGTGVADLSPRFVLGSLLVLVLLSVWAVLRVVRTKVVVGGGEVVVHRPFTRSARFARGVVTVAGRRSLARTGEGEAVPLPTWWLLSADVERLLASIESELGVRFPPGSRAWPASRRRRRGDIQW